jgi:hypothetical protein
MDKRVTWSDLQQAPVKDLKRIYKLDDRGVEMATRRHMDGANPSERRELYKTVWDSKDGK